MRVYNGELTGESFVGRLRELAPTREELEALAVAIRGAQTPEAAARAVELAVPRLAPLAAEFYGFSPQQWAIFLVAFLPLLAKMLELSGLKGASDVAETVSVTLGAGLGLLAADAWVRPKAPGARALKERKERRKQQRKARRQSRR